MRAGKRAVVVLSMVIVFMWAAAAHGATPESGFFSGGTSQSGGSLSFEVSSEGTAVTNLKANMFADCSNGVSIRTIEVGLTPTPTIKIKNGMFSYAGGFDFHNGPTVIGHGKGTVNGSFNSATHAIGTLRFPWDFFPGAGSLSDFHCDTGKVSFGASPLSSFPVSSSSSSKCVVPKVKGKRLRLARRALRLGNCRLGRVVHRKSIHLKRRRVVVAQKPRAGARLKAGARVRLVVANGSAR